MSVTVSINSAQIAAKIRGASQRAVAITAQQALTDCNNYCPEDQGVLINSSIENSVLEEGRLVWSAPYARYLYHGVLMVDPKTGSPYAREGQTKVVLTPEKPLDFNKHPNPNAGSHWCERAYADHHDDWERIYQEAFRKELENGGTG